MDFSVFEICFNKNIAFDEISQKLKILDTTKSNYNFIEKFVYDTVKHHLARLNLNNIESYKIEFWTKSNISIKNRDTKWKTINNFHVDCDEILKETKNRIVNPLLSIVSYFTENNFPVILTEIDNDDYKYKKFENKNNICIIFPEKNKQICFDGKYMHGVVNIFDENEYSEVERKIIAINIWENNILQNHETYISNDAKYEKEPTIMEIKKIENHLCNLEINTPMDFDFYNRMLYFPDYVVPMEIQEKIKLNSSQSLFCKNYSISQKIICNDETCLKNNITTQILDILEDKIKYNNRFLQRFVVSNIYSKTVCEWIITEADNYANINGWTTTRHTTYPTTDIPVENIKPIFPFIFNSFQSIFECIDRLYCTEKALKYNIRDLFIVKYSEDAQNYLEEHQDFSFFSVNILLNDESEFVGGGTTFEDGIHYDIKQGDMIIHSGRLKHTGNKITKGKRYILVAFINILFE